MGGSERAARTVHWSPRQQAVQPAAALPKAPTPDCPSRGEEAPGLVRPLLCPPGPGCRPPWAEHQLMEDRTNTLQRIKAVQRPSASWRPLRPGLLEAGLPRPLPRSRAPSAGKPGHSFLTGLRPFLRKRSRGGQGAHGERQAPSQHLPRCDHSWGHWGVHTAQEAITGPPNPDELSKGEVPQSQKIPWKQTEARTDWGDVCGVGGWGSLRM